MRVGSAGRRRILTPYCLLEGVALALDLSAPRVGVGPLRRLPQALVSVLASLKAPRPSSGHRRASSPARPSETGPGLGGVPGVSGSTEAGLPLSHGGVRHPFRSEVRGASGRKGLGWCRGCQSLSQRWHLSAGAGDPGWREPEPSSGDPGAAARGGAEGRRDLLGGPQGRCFADRYCGSAPVRGAGRPPAGRTNHRGPMTTRPNPSRLGSRDATQGEPVVATSCVCHCLCCKSALT